MHWKVELEAGGTPFPRVPLGLDRLRDDRHAQWSKCSSPSPSARRSARRSVTRYLAYVPADRLLIADAGVDCPRFGQSGSDPTWIHGSCWLCIFVGCVFLSIFHCVLRQSMVLLHIIFPPRAPGDINNRTRLQFIKYCVHGIYGGLPSWRNPAKHPSATEGDNKPLTPAQPCRWRVNNSLLAYFTHTHIPHPTTQHTLAPVLPSLGLCLGVRGYCSQRIRV